MLTKRIRSRYVIFTVTNVKCFRFTRCQNVRNTQNARAISTRNIITSIYQDPFLIISSTQDGRIRIRIHRRVNTCRRNTILFMRNTCRSNRYIFIFMCIVTIRLRNGLTALKIICACVPTATSARIITFKSSVSRTFIILRFISNLHYTIYKIIISSSGVVFRIYLLRRCQLSNVTSNASAITRQGSSKNLVFRIANERLGLLRLQYRVSPSFFRVFNAYLLRLGLTIAIFKICVIRGLFTTLTNVIFRLTMWMFISVCRI